MDDKDYEYAVKQYRKYGDDFTAEDFWEDVKEHIKRRPYPHNSYSEYSDRPLVMELWDALNMDMADIVERSNMSMAAFARRFFIPYRTMQAWCDGTNECPIYIKLMICDILNLLPRKKERERYRTVTRISPFMNML